MSTVQKYNKDSEEIVIINVSGTIFQVPANILSHNSSFFDTKISVMNIGETLYIPRSIIGFQHILERIYRSNYTIPSEYIDETYYYGLKSCNWMESNTTIRVINSGKIYELSSGILDKSPKLTQLMNECNMIPPLHFEQKAFKMLINCLCGNKVDIHGKSYIMADKRYEYIFQWAGVEPDDYYHIVYRYCEKHCRKGGGCENMFKTKIFTGGIYLNYACATHRCKVCKSDGSPYCDKHICQQFFCFGRVVDGETKCSEHLNNKSDILTQTLKAILS